MTRATKRRRNRGTGTVYRDAKRGRWIGAVTIDGKRRKVVAGNKIDATTRLRELTESKPSDTPVERSAATVAEAIDVFLNRDLPGRRRGGRPLAPATITGYRWACDLIAGHLGWVGLFDLNVTDVEAFYDELAKGDEAMTAASLRKVRTTLHQVLDVAERRGQVARNVAAIAKLPAAADAKPRRALDPADARKLLEALRDEPHGLLFGLSLRLGLRPGEAAAVTWADMEGDVLHVRHGRRAVGGKVEIVDELKTVASRRSIELPADVAAWLADHRRHTFGDVTPLRLDGLLMFPAPSGGPLDPSNMRRTLADICERAGVPVVRPNELRHSCASLLSDMGVPHQEIADLLGHTTTRIVDQTYRHRLRPVVDVAARADWMATSG